ASLSLDEGIVKRATRSVSLGVGIRVRRGEASGYAFSEDLSWDALVEAAQTAASIADRDPREPARIAERDIPRRYSHNAFEVGPDCMAKRQWLLDADRAARAADGRITHVHSSLVETVREFLVAT